MSLNGDYRVCRALAREHDRDRYLAALFAPGGKARALFALTAFNAEVARIRDLVSEPMLGELRLQWWRDAVDGRAAGDAGRSPVAHALADAIGRFDLAKANLHELVDARAFDLYADPMQSLAQLETYLDSTSGSLVRLAAQVLNGKESADISLAALHAGRAYGIAGLLRSFAPNAAHGRIFVPPVEVLSRHGTSAEDALSGEAKPALLAAFREMRDLARFHLMEAEKLRPSLPGTVSPAFLPLDLVPLYLAQMETPGYDPFHTIVEISPWRRTWTLWRASRNVRRRRPRSPRQEASDRDRFSPGS